MPSTSARIHWSGSQQESAGKQIETIKETLKRDYLQKYLEGLRNRKKTWGSVMASGK